MPRVLRLREVLLVALEVLVLLEILELLADAALTVLNTAEATPDAHSIPMKA